MPVLRSALVLVFVAALCASAGAGTYYRDSDRDGYGLADAVVTAPSMPPGYADNGLDCNDNDPHVHPGAPESCNGRDDDCDGSIDEAVTPIPTYRDLDGDGYGQTAVMRSVCPVPPGYVLYPGDCDDTNPLIHPSATERCGNGIDDDCDGSVDEGCGAPFAIAFIADVPADQGHAVLVEWHAQPYDGMSGAPVGIVRYEVRRQPVGGNSLPSGWDVVATIPASALVDYQVNAATPCIENPAKSCATTFMVRAFGDTPGVFFDTAPASGTAVDNLPPDPPEGLVATYVPNSVTLEWAPGPSPDVTGFRVYSMPTFEGFPQLVATRSADDRQFTGPYGAKYRVTYGVTAVDSAGLESAMSRPSTVGVGESDLPNGLGLASPSPNPSRGDVLFSWTMPETGTARLTIVDLAGRTVRLLAAGTRTAGPQMATWDGRDARGQVVRPGAYFARLDSPWGSRSRMLVRAP